MYSVEVNEHQEICALALVGATTCPFPSICRGDPLYTTTFSEFVSRSGFTVSQIFFLGFSRASASPAMRLYHGKKKGVGSLMPIIGQLTVKKKNPVSYISILSMPNISTIYFKTYLMGLSCFSYDKGC